MSYLLQYKNIFLSCLASLRIIFYWRKDAVIVPKEGEAVYGAIGRDHAGKREDIGIRSLLPFDRMRKSG